MYFVHIQMSDGACGRLMLVVTPIFFLVHAKGVNARLPKQFMPIWSLRDVDASVTDADVAAASGDDQEQCAKSADFKGFNGMTAKNTGLVS